MTIAGTVFSKATTQTIHLVAAEYNGSIINTGYVFPDASVIRIDGISIGYCADDTHPYPFK